MTEEPYNFTQMTRFLLNFNVSCVVLSFCTTENSKFLQIKLIIDMIICVTFNKLIY